MREAQPNEADKRVRRRAANAPPARRKEAVIAPISAAGPADSAPAAMLKEPVQETLSLGEQQKRICERVLNVFETGSPEGKYGAISIYADGPNDIRQVTYGRSQTTEYGNLRELIAMYADANGMFSAEFKPFVPLIGRTPLVQHAKFKQLLRSAGNDPVMQATQDAFFDRRYFRPAMAWAARHGFKLGLSALVIYDSFIHSGGVLDLLRARFPERPPSHGGNEKKWTAQYVNARHAWLASHSRKILRGTVYRTRCFQAEIARENWDLARLPIMANGVAIGDAPPRKGMSVMLVGAQRVPEADLVPFLGQPEE